ncbi:MAG: manganese efflux pump MntP family protein [Acidimicrobiia bacterium]
MNSLIQIIFIAIGLAMDAFSVSTAIGMRAKNHRIKQAIKISFIFATFQAVMPLIGWGISAVVRSFVEDYGKQFAFIVLLVLGLKMIYESLKSDRENISDHPSINRLLILGFATSIDALLVGTTLRLIKINVLVSIFIIGLITFSLCIVAYYFGKQVGKIFKNHVEIVGGVVLIIIAITFLFS